MQAIAPVRRAPQVSTTTGAGSSIAWGDQHAELIGICKKLEPLNQILLAGLMEHLGKVAANHAANKMKPGNIGVVFGPTLLRLPDEALLDHSAVARANVVATKLLGCSAELTRNAEAFAYD